MSWALKRQIFYLSILMLFFGVVGFWIGYPYFNKPPTCFDGKKNGDERGVDCGPSCPRVCNTDTDKISVLWARSFEVVPSRYNAVAYIENHNPNMAVHNIKYRFRFADENNIFIGQREGEIFIPPAGKYAIFEPAINLGFTIPVYTSFEFLEEPVWLNVPREKVQQLRVSVSDIVYDDMDGPPKLYALLKNNSLFSISDIIVVAILYDEKGNAIHTSKTYVDKLNGEGQAPITFTWLLPFESRVFRREIVPMFNILTAEFR